MTTTATPARRTGTSRKVRALLAGGLVLGLGAAATLAAWNDSEVADGTFTAGTFNLQGSTTGATSGYADHAAADGAAALSFTAPVGNLSPSDVVYAPFWVRLAEGTTTPATLDVVSIDSTDTTGTNSGQLGYSVYAIDADATCDATATGGTLLGTGATLADGAPTGGDPVDLEIGTPTTAAGEAVQLCFIVTAAAGLEQGGVTTATWQLTATTD